MKADKTEIEVPMEAIGLSALCGQISSVLNCEMDGVYRVRAEVSSLAVRGGHCYMELSESGPDGGLVAKVRATCWSRTWTALSAYFVSVAGQPLLPGMHVLLDVEVSFHAVYGLSLNVLDIDPAYTLGALERKRLETIAALQASGLMDLQKHLVLPTLVQRIAVVSAAGAAGYEDFCDQLSRSGYAFRTRLFPAIMQGEQSPASIMSALEQVFAEEGRWDLVVIIRGGGAVSDLSCFDDYRLCEYCAQFPLPILTGVGHTRDVSILDMVSYVSVKTPTAAAEWLRSRMERESERLRRLQSFIRSELMQGLLSYRHALEMIERTIALQSPESIYRRGYSLVMKGGHPVRSVQELQAGDIISASFADGTVKAKTL